MFPIPKRRKNRDQRQDDNVTDVEMPNTMITKTNNNEDNNNNNDDRPRISNYITNPINDQAKTIEQEKQCDISNNNEINDDDAPLLGSESNDLSWARVGRSVDRLSRLVIPLAFIIEAIKLIVMSRA